MGQRDRHRSLVVGVPREDFPSRRLHFRCSGKRRSDLSPSPHGHICDGQHDGRTVASLSHVTAVTAITNKPGYPSKPAVVRGGGRRVYDPRRLGTLEEAMIAVTGHDAEEVFCLGLAVDGRYEEGCLERIGEDDPHEEKFLRGIWEDGDDRGSSRRRSRAGWRSGRVGLNRVEPDRVRRL